MRMETQFPFHKELSEKLHALIRFNRDAHAGFLQAAEEIQNPHLSRLFRDLAQERAAMSTELKEYVGSHAEHEASPPTAVRRYWIGIHHRIADGEAHAILADVERPEDFIESAYEEVLQDLPESDFKEILRHQHARVKSVHNRIRDLRDSYQT